MCQSCGLGVDTTDCCRTLEALLRREDLQMRSLLAGCLTPQQNVSVSQGRICLDKCTCCHAEIKVAGQTFYLTLSHYNDTEPTSTSADPIAPVTWQSSY